jgi:phosphate transport system protein
LILQGFSGYCPNSSGKLKRTALFIYLLYYFSHMLSTELNDLKKDVLRMGVLVQAQMHKAKETLLKFDKDLAYEVMINEKRIDSYELKISRDCESILALFKPGAADLRFVLASFKIVGNLERCGDYAEWISRYISEIESSFKPSLLKSCHIFEFFEDLDTMLSAVQQAYESNESTSLHKVFMKDEALGSFRLKAIGTISDYIKNNPADAQTGLYLFSIIMKLERMGDQIKNVAKEIIFYLEATLDKRVRKNTSVH